MNCPECNKQISDMAQFCPHCGYPLKYNIQSKNFHGEKLLKPKDIKEILGCSLPVAYNIVNCSDFPKIKIGKRAYIPEAAFEKWIKNYTGKEYRVK